MLLLEHLRCLPLDHRCATRLGTSSTSLLTAAEVGVDAGLKPGQRCRKVTVRLCTGAAAVAVHGAVEVVRATFEAPECRNGDAQKWDRLKVGAL